MREYNVHIIAAIRNEVYINVLSKGLEINKTTHDFGTQISWQQKGGDIKEHPLLKMLEKRILYSERMAGIESSQNVWKDYFTPTIGRSKIIIRNYILDQTWYKPRDIIRMFSIIQTLQGKKLCRPIIFCRGLDIRGVENVTIKFDIIRLHLVADFVAYTIIYFG